MRFSILVAVLAAASLYAQQQTDFAKRAQQACLSEQGRLPSAWEAEKLSANTPIEEECVFVIEEGGVLGGEAKYGAVSTKSWKQVKAKERCARRCITFEPRRAERGLSGAQPMSF